MRRTAPSPFPFVPVVWACLATLLLATTGEAAPPPDRIVTDDSNPRWLFRADGRPVFLCGPGDPEGFLFRGTLLPDGTRAGDQTAIIDRLAGTGANCLYVMAVRSHGGDGGATENPFVDHDPYRGLNGAVLDQWRGWFDELDAAGVVVFLILYDDSANPFPTGDTVTATETAFIRGLVDRFQDVGNLVWCVAEEYSEALTTSRASAIAAEIRAADDSGHPIAVHQRHGLSFDFPDDPSVDQFAIQYNVPTADGLHAGVLEAWETAGGRYQLNLSEAEAWGTGSESRLKSWACAMGGAYVMILGMDVISTPTSDLEDCGRLVSFFESTGFPDMSPRDDLANAGTKWVLAAEDGECVLYAPDLSGPLGRTDTTAGRYTLRWLDCATGTTVEQSVVSAGGSASWPKPAGLGPEVAVHVVPESTTPIEATSWADVKARYRPAD